jgi:hypothetical protein
MNIQCILLLYYIIHIGGLITNKKNNIILSKILTKIKSNINDYQYDWTSGEVAWEYDNCNDIINESQEYNVLGNNIYDNSYSEINYNTNSVIETNVIEIKYIKTNIILNNDFDNKLIWKAITSGIMKGIYIQIMTIDNIIAYMQCYKNKVVEIDIILSIMYIIFYEKNKSIEKQNIITLKSYNNIYLLEKYMKLRRESSIIVLIIYIIFFRGISNAE